MSSTQVSHERVTPEQLEAWRTLVRAVTLIIRRLENDLLDRHGISLAWYEVLARLVEAEGHRLRMSELADGVMLSPSGLTRLVDRMVDAGVVRREQSASDARSFYAVLTDEGYERLRTATGTHMRGIHEYLLSKYTDEELQRAAAFVARLQD
ncbi:MAG: MarR family transcriptional regulator [Jiangellaceae bacterium]|nr:MarR family transcriptional regulator [Jiangellaceae bacterium]